MLVNELQLRQSFKNTFKTICESLGLTFIEEGRTIASTNEIEFAQEKLVNVKSNYDIAGEEEIKNGFYQITVATPKERRVFRTEKYIESIKSQLSLGNSMGINSASQTVSIIKVETGTIWSDDTHNMKVITLYFMVSS